MTLAVKASIQCFQPFLHQPQSETLISLSLSHCLSHSLSHFVTQGDSRRPEFLFSFFFFFCILLLCLLAILENCYWLSLDCLLLCGGPTSRREDAVAMTSLRSTLKESKLEIWNRKKPKSVTWRPLAVLFFMFLSKCSFFMWFAVSRTRTLKRFLGQTAVFAELDHGWRFSKYSTLLFSRTEKNNSFFSFLSLLVWHRLVCMMFVYVTSCPQAATARW